jgi:hypothetical protein
MMERRMVYGHSRDIVTAQEIRNRISLKVKVRFGRGNGAVSPFGCCVEAKK